MVVLLKLQLAKAIMKNITIERASAVFDGGQCNNLLAVVL
jgi:hypothetical protein